MQRKPLIVGVGAALVDLLLEESDAFLSAVLIEHACQKGGMTMVDSPALEKALKRSFSEPKVVPGGSACNTLVGIGHLGGQARMIGRVGQDAFAGHFISGLKQAGVEGHLKESQAGITGRVLSVVTPDAQRTMFTHLGASAELQPEDINEASIAGSALLYLEGYLLFNRPVVEHLLAIAGKHLVPVALDLGSFQVVEICRPLLESLFARKQVQIVLANEDEARAFTGLGVSESLEKFALLADLAVVKQGEAGVLLARGSERLQVNAQLAKAIDTTGAGDLWAAGFLYGLNHGLSLENAAHLGCKVGAEVVQILGASIPVEGWNRIHAYREKL